MSKKERMPVLFVGHGSPMNAIEDNEFSRTWAELGRTLPRPEAVLCISAHWETRGTGVTAMSQPRTIHDFYGFPRELNVKEYPAPGSSALVELVKQAVRSVELIEDSNWGLDHGSWSVLCRMYPDASIPVVELSLNRDLSLEQHYQLGEELAPLRDEGILILGSGNMVHNLRMFNWEDAGYDWAIEYDTRLKEWIAAGAHDQVVHYEQHGEPASLSVNSEEHYLPLLYVLGAGGKTAPVTFYNERVIMGSISMRCVKLG
jgi:4,5-DOPA dioxygenase extradiol